MTRIEEIKAAIESLSISERGQLERWLHGWVDDEWDKKIAQDVASGRLDSVISKVDQAIDEDNLRDLP